MKDLAALTRFLHLMTWDFGGIVWMPWRKE